MKKRQRRLVTSLNTLFVALFALASAPARTVVTPSVNSCGSNSSYCCTSNCDPDSCGDGECGGDCIYNGCGWGTHLLDCDDD